MSESIAVMRSLIIRKTRTTERVVSSPTQHPSPYPPLLHHGQGEGQALNPLPRHGVLSKITQHKEGGEGPGHDLPHLLLVPVPRLLQGKVQDTSVRPVQGDGRGGD